MAEIKAESDRELLVQLNADINSIRLEVRNSMDRIIDMVGRFEKALVHLEDNKINGVIKKQDEFDDWKQQISGGWKALVVVFIIITTVGVGAIIKLFSLINNH